MSIAKSALAPDDPIKAYVWMTWSRIASVLKADFAPCLPIVLESLMAGVSGVEVLSAPEEASNPVVNQSFVTSSLDSLLPLQATTVHRLKLLVGVSGWW